MRVLLKCDARSSALYQGIGISLQHTVKTRGETRSKHVHGNPAKSRLTQKRMPSHACGWEPENFFVATTA